MNKRIVIICVLTLSLFFIAISPSFAQQGGKRFTTRVGNPITSSSLTAQIAKELGEAFLKNCPATIELSGRNISCIKNHLPSSITYPEAAYAELLTSATNYTFLQCVGFVQAVSAAVTGKRIEERGIVNYASEYANTIGYVSPQYTFINKKDGTIEPGDFPVWAGLPGHIAVATEVYDKNNFKIVEANYGYRGQINFRATTVDNPLLLGWLRKK